MNRINLLSLLLATTVALFAFGCDSSDTETDAGATVADTGTTPEADSGTTGGGSTGGGWGDECTADSDCTGDTDLCVINPMVGPPGYCSIACATNSDCTGADMDWTCNAVASCDMPLGIWCGPQSEIAMGGGVLIECP